MTPLVDQVLDEIQGAWRHRWPALAAAAVFALVGWLVIFSLPDLYEAEARVFVDTGTALTPVLQGLAVEQDVNAQLNYVRQSLLAGPQLVNIARDSGVLPATVTDPARQNQILDQFSSRVFIDVANAGGGSEDQNSAGTIYDIRYRDGNRDRSLRVVGTLLQKLVSETLGGKQAGAQNAHKFLATQIQDYAKRLSAAEDRLAAFKKANLGLMPTEQGGYFGELQAELQAVSDDEIKIQKARTRRDVLEAQLHGNAAIAAVGTAQPGANGTGDGAGNDINSLIAQAQAHLDALQLRFTDKHPDVIAAKEILAELKQRRAAELESLRKGDADAAAITGAGSNPVYQSIEQELNETDLQMADLNTDLAQHRKKSADLRALLNTAPQVEAQYEQLTRDYAANTAEYNALLEKDEKARLGERAGDAGSVQFNVVQPPTADFAPVWPRRARWLAGVLVLAFGLGGALAYGLHQLQPVIYSATGLTQLTGARVLGVVGSAYPSLKRRASRRDTWRLTAAFVCFMLVFAVALILSGVGFRLSGIFFNHLVNV